MSIFTNKSTVELIPQNKINSDWGVIRAGKASFNNFDESKYFDENGTVNEVGIKFIARLLHCKHKSTFFLSNLEFFTDTQIDYNKLTKEEIAGMERCLNGTQYHYVISVYLAMRWLYYKPNYISVEILEVIEYQLKQHFQVCDKALEMLPEEDVTEEEKDLLARCKTKFISFKGELPIFIARQFYRHRGINFTERSGRYTAENTRFYKPDNWRKAPEKATQGSIENRFAEEWLTSNDMSYENILELQNEWFQSNINKKEECGDLGNICKEQARTILSQSQITTTINAVNLCTLSSVLSQRLDEHAQLEIREVAKQLYDIACKEFRKELVDKLIDIQSRLIF